MSGTFYIYSTLGALIALAIFMFFRRPQERPVAFMVDGLEYEIEQRDGLVVCKNDTAFNGYEHKMERTILFACRNLHKLTPAPPALKCLDSYGVRELRDLHCKSCGVRFKNSLIRQISNECGGRYGVRICYKRSRERGM